MFGLNLACFRRATWVLQRAVLLRSRVLRPAEATSLRQPPGLQGLGLRQLLLPAQGQLDGAKHLLQRGPQPHDHHVHHHTQAAVKAAGWEFQWDWGNFLRCPLSTSPLSHRPAEEVKWQWMKVQFKHYASPILRISSDPLQEVFLEVTFVKSWVGRWLWSRMGWWRWRSTENDVQIWRLLFRSKVQERKKNIQSLRYIITVLNFYPLEYQWLCFWKQLRSQATFFCCFLVAILSNST